MRAALALTLSSSLALAPVASAKAAGAERPRVAISVSPAQLSVAAPSSRTITLRNDGLERVAVDVRRAPASTPNGWLQVVPARLFLRPGRSSFVTLRVRLPRGAEPGDHHALVLLTTRPFDGSRVPLQVRLGVRVKVRVPGRVLRHLWLGGLRVQQTRGARFMFISVANRGNVTVQLRGHVTASLFRRGRQLAHLSPLLRRALLPPGTRALLAFRYVGHVRGSVTALVRVRLGPGARRVERRYRVRL